jgi:hypothetical protein
MENTELYIIYGTLDELEEQEIVIKCCDLCQWPLLHGDTVYKLMNKYICKECIENAESEVE